MQLTFHISEFSRKRCFFGFPLPQPISAVYVPGWGLKNKYTLYLGVLYGTYRLYIIVPPSGPVPNRTLRWKQGKVYITSITFQSMLLK
jgi:hypothetical protein